MIAYHQFYELLENYSAEAAVEYSHYEKTRHEHFVYDDYDCSHKIAIKHWKDFLAKGISGKLGDAILFEAGEKIVERSTEGIRAFYASLEDDEDKRFFLQVLMKTERKLLNLDLERFKAHKNEIPAVAATTIRIESVRKSEPIQNDSVAVSSSANQADLIRAIKEKKFISVKEFEILYNISKRTQQNLRTRFRNPLPSKQNGRGGKVFYDIAEVDKWLENERI